MKNLFYAFLKIIQNKANVILTLYVLFCFLPSTGLMAQKNKKGDAALAIGAAALGIGGAIASIEEIKEQLESDAVDYILMNHPELNEFRIKCLFKRGDKLSDQSGSSAIVFQLTTLNKSIKKEERKVLIRFNNDRFINENGLKINKVDYFIIESKEWNAMLAFFGNLIGVGDSIIENDYNFNVPLYIPSKCNDEEAILAKHYNLVGEQSERCFKKKGANVPISRLVFERNAFKFPSHNFEIKEYPFHKLKGDDYIVGDFSSSFKIFANEKTIGIFVKSIRKSILLRRTIVRDIHSFINFQEVMYPTVINY